MSKIVYTVVPEPSSVAPAGNGGIPVIQAYRSQSHGSPVYQRPEGFCCLRKQAAPSAEGD